MAVAFAPSSTFSESQVKRAPAALAREGRLGSPANWCERIPCSAMGWGCLAGAMARASSNFRDGNPCALRSWFTALNSSRSASEEFCCARPLAEQRISKALSIATRYGIRMTLPRHQSCHSEQSEESLSMAGLPERSLDPQLFPLLVHQRLGFFVHQNLIRPGTRESFAGPFAGGIDAHLRSVVGQAGSVVERIDGPQHELNIALRIDVVEHLERDLADVLHVDVFVDHENALGEHSLTERPDRIHHFARLSRIRLLDGNDHQIMIDTFNGKVDVDDFRDGEFHERKKNALDRFTHPPIFHRRLAHDGGGVDRVSAMRDATEMKNRIKILKRIEAGMISEGAFGFEFVEVDVAFEDDFCAGGDFEVDGFALDQFDGCLAEESGDEIFLDVGGRGDDGGKRNCGIGADGDGDFHLAGGPVAIDEYGPAR